MKRVLITGASGLIGQILTRSLADSYEVTGIDAKRHGPFQRGRGDMTRLRAIRPAFEGQDVVIDLAADGRRTSPWRRVYRNNIPATHNALEAARQADVPRVVFASSNHVTGVYEHDEPYAAIVAGRYAGLEPGATRLINSGDAIRPDSFYAVGKAFGEALGRHYSELHGLSVICLRLGTVNAIDRPTEPRHFANLLTHADLDRLVRCAIEAPPDLRFGVYAGVSNNTWRIWDIENARADLGYAPQDDAEAWR